MRETLNPASGPVLVAAALIVSPALWHGLVLGELPLDVALTRYLVAVVGCWLALGLFLQFLPEPAAKQSATTAPAPLEPTLVTPAMATGNGAPEPDLSTPNDPYS
ncbi:hypothetical protein ACLM5J_01775 [Nocardioides sp. Bht2]|uniref:hypothetical protein n=1 Tax=Nocardioides sp. Bht2 TaxID=3392297 RepID=UPI0039B4020C